MNDFINISIKLAAALLLQQGKISISDIQALPFVENEDTVNIIVNSLTSAYHLERYQHREATGYSWEDVFRFRNPENNITGARTESQQH